MAAVGRFRAALLLASLLSGTAINDNEAEKFPLSGGVLDGVSIKVKVSGYSDNGKKALSFLDPDEKNLFYWELNTTANFITRQRQDDSDWTGVQAWGIYSLAADESATFTFLRTKFMWEVSINNVRTPWFDYPAQPTDLIVHVVVYNGFQNVEVTQERPSCSKVCHPEECQDASGTNVCKDANGVDASECHALLPSDNYNSAATCTTLSETDPESGMSCCDEMPRVLSLSDVNQVQWLQVISDQAMLDGGCTAILGGVCNVSPEGKVKVASVTGESAEVWYPAAHQQDDSQLTTIPRFVLTLPQVEATVVHIARVDMEWGDLPDSVNLKDGMNLITKTGGMTHIEENWFILAMHEVATQDVLHPWVPFIKDRWEYWGDSAQGDDGVILLVADVLPVDLQSKCVDMSQTDFDSSSGQWADSQGRTCWGYASGSLCDRSGIPTGSWNTAHPNDGYGAFAAFGKYAPKACCVCGGGYYPDTDLRNEPAIGGTVHLTKYLPPGIQMAV